jgi:hypothetical protein
VNHGDVEPGTARPRFDLHDAFKGKEEELLAALRTGRRVAGHPTVQGDGTEMHWRSMLEAVLPTRYEVAPAIVVDSRGERSEQIDLVVRDKHFSPLLWEWGGHLYVPAESVYAVFEVKPQIDRNYVLYGARKIASARALHRTSTSFGWAMGTMPARDLRPIIGGFLAAASGWRDTFGDSFHRALSDAEAIRVGDDANANGRIDVGCVLGHGTFEIPHGSSSHDVVISTAETALSSFTLTLLKRLQGIGSVPAIDYDAYAQWLGAGATR